MDEMTEETTNVDSQTTRASDRFVPKSVSGDMVLINSFSSPFSSTKKPTEDGKDSTGRMRSALWKSYVRSPQRILTFNTGQRSSGATARRESLSAIDIASDTPIAEANVLKQLSTDGEKNGFSSLSSSSSDISRSAIHRRIIPRKPFQILRVPGMQDDFYMSPLDWSSSNLIVVSLPSGIHMWDANTTLSYSFTDREEAEKNPVNCLAWRKGSHVGQLAEGLSSGLLRIRDTEEEKISGTWNIHSNRIGTCSWSPKGTLIATGSKDHTIGIIDPREQHHEIPVTGHNQEVCGIKWDPEGVLLASGGNDNNMILWDHRMMNTPLRLFENAHCAAIKALAWSPHRRGRLVSGGGTADRRIRFWDVETLSCIGEVDSGSQVCNVAWSENTDEIVSTHGFSQNQIVVWDTSASTSTSTSTSTTTSSISDAPLLRPALPIATLRGHTSRVLHLAVSPDGRSIATCAVDNTLRFWSVFPGKNAPLMLSIPPKTGLPSTKTVKTAAVKQQCSDSQSLTSSSVESALMSECSLDLR